jgi:hypothetical protein
MFGIYNIVVMLALLPVLGIYGAAIASGSAQALKNLFIWWHVRRRARWMNVRAALLFGFLLWSGVVALGYLFKEITEWHPFVDLVTGAVVIGLAFLLHVRTPAIARSDRRLLELILGGKERAALRRVGLVDTPSASS